MSLDFAAGCLGGCAGIMVGYPLDTIKVHIQTQDHRNPKYKGTWHCFRSILARDSVAGFYRGMSSPMAGVAVVNAIVFGVYGTIHKNLSEPDHLGSHFLAGASAGLAQTPICSPMELAKTRIQLQSSNTFSGPLHCLKDIYRRKGFKGVFSGLGITFLREIPSYGIYFFTYEALTKSSAASAISTLQMLLAGGLAGTASWIFTYPLDVVKSRLQADTSGKYSSALDCFRKSINSEGYKCLFRGLNSTIIRAFPTNAATFAVVTWTFRLFNHQPPAEVKPVTSNRVVPAAETYATEWNLMLNNFANQELQFSRSNYSSLSTSMVNISMLADEINNQDHEEEFETKQDEDVEDEWAPESRYNEFRIAVTS
ncbi:mitochondrial basic amino acids transporter-like [Belonocnema kinseyi]|uniref:mitochondrial basic amino acids transporter-like n=1 Tax=Belonocnema kinseyi TaxID=2817044 RepID=UPI00143D1629|nr:mitochondrial basic amino acids transporter-like [Belonocnema kinseyi]